MSIADFLSDALICQKFIDARSNAKDRFYHVIHTSDFLPVIDQIFEENKQTIKKINNSKAAIMTWKTRQQICRTPENP